MKDRTCRIINASSVFEGVIVGF